MKIKIKMHGTIALLAIVFVMPIIYFAFAGKVTYTEPLGCRNLPYGCTLPSGFTGWPNLR